METALPILLAIIENAPKAIALVNTVRANLSETDEAKLKAALAAIRAETDAAVDGAIAKADAAAKL
jgi:hypothetical protein